MPFWSHSWKCSLCQPATTKLIQFNISELVHLFSLTLSTIRPSTGQNKCHGNILLYKTAVFTVKMANHYRNHRCLVEKNVPIVLILSSRWQDGAESQGKETTSCLCHLPTNLPLYIRQFVRFVTTDCCHVFLPTTSSSILWESRLWTQICLFYIFDQLFLFRIRQLRKIASQKLPPPTFYFLLFLFDANFLSLPGNHLRKKW